LFDVETRTTARLPFETAHFTARHVRQGSVGFIAFVEQVPALMAWGATREEAESNLKKRFAAWVALERSHGNLLDEFTLFWV
jgi:predicted RNase H-like HicB family nuclease